MPELVFPNFKYKKSYFAAFQEYLDEEKTPQRYLDNRQFFDDDNLEGYIERIRKGSQGIDLPAGYVPWTEYWLVEGDKFLGTLSLRHELNDWLHKVGGHIGYDISPSQRGKGYGKLILELGLEKAKELGLEKILVTCDVDNTPSRKIIEANGGVFENTIEDKNRYWIKI